MSKYFGDRQFYKRVIAIVLPIVVQQLITNFVSMLDNIMVGQVGTYPMSGVAIANQLIFVFTLCIFGAISGAGIFGAQFYGDENHEGVRQAFRYKLWVSVIITLGAIAIFLLWDTPLISSYLNGTAEENALTLGFAKDYLAVMLIGLLPYALTQIYASTLRETGQTFVPMLSGLIAVGVNLFLNWVFIFGKLGAPALGVVGAAVATVISRFVELAIIAIWTHANAWRNLFAQGLYKTLLIPKEIVGKITKKGLPLLMNEALWSMSMAMILRCYSVRGIDVVAAYNINSTITQLFNVIALAMGNAIAILIGQLLGAGEMEQARDKNRKLITFGLLLGVGVGAVMAACSGLFPKLYDTTDGIRSMAAGFICIAAAYMPVLSYVHSAYFTLRSGGRTGITVLFDCVYSWLVYVPVAYLLSSHTRLPILAVFAIVQGTDLLKAAVGAVLIKKGIWLRNIVK